MRQEHEAAGHAVPAVKVHPKMNDGAHVFS